MATQKELEITSAPFRVTICYNGTNVPESYKVCWGHNDKEYAGKDAREKVFEFARTLRKTGVCLDNIAVLSSVHLPQSSEQLEQSRQESEKLRRELIECSVNAV